MYICRHRQRDISGIFAITIVFFVAQLKSHKLNSEVPTCSSSYRREEQNRNGYFCLIPVSLSWFEAKTFCRQNKQILLADIPSDQPLIIPLHNKGIKRLWINKRKPSLPQRCPLLFLYKSDNSSQTVNLNSIHSAVCQEKHAAICYSHQKIIRRFKITVTPVISIEQPRVPESSNTLLSSGTHFSTNEASVRFQEHILDWKINREMPITQLHIQSIPSKSGRSTVGDFQNYLAKANQTSQNNFLPYEVHRLFRRQAGHGLNRENKSEIPMLVHGSQRNRSEPDSRTIAAEEKIHSSNEDNVSFFGKTQDSYPILDFKSDSVTHSYPKIEDNNNKKKAPEAGNESDFFKADHLIASDKDRIHLTEHETGKEDKTKPMEEQSDRFNETNLILSSGDSSVGLGDSSEVKSRPDNESSLFQGKETINSPSSNVLQYSKTDVVSQTMSDSPQADENIEITHGDSSLEKEKKSPSFSNYLSNDESYSRLDNEKDEHKNQDGGQGSKSEEDSVTENFSEVADRKRGSKNFYKIKHTGEEETSVTPNNVNLNNLSNHFHLARNQKFQNEASNLISSKSKLLSVGTRQIHQGTSSLSEDRNFQTERADISYSQEDIPNSNLSESMDIERESLQRNNEEMTASKPGNRFEFNNRENDWQDDSAVLSDVSPNVLSTVRTKNQDEQLESEFERLFDRSKSTVIDRDDLATRSKGAISGESSNSAQSIMDSVGKDQDADSQFINDEITGRGNKSELDSTISLEDDTDLKIIKQNRPKNRGLNFENDNEFSESIQTDDQNKRTELSSDEIFIPKSDIENRESHNHSHWHRHRSRWLTDGKLDNNEELSFEIDSKFQISSQNSPNDEHEKEFEHERKFRQKNQFSISEETKELEPFAIDDENKKENRFRQKGNSSKPFSEEENDLIKGNENNQFESMSEDNTREMLINNEDNDPGEGEVTLPGDRNAALRSKEKNDDKEEVAADDETSSEIFRLDNTIYPLYNKDNVIDADDRKSELFNEKKLSRDSYDEEDREFRNEEYDLANSDKIENRSDGKREIEGNTSEKDGDQTRTGSQNSFEDEDEDHQEHGENRPHKTLLEITEQDETTEKIDISEPVENLNISILLNGTLTNIAAAKFAAMSSVEVNSIVDITNTLENATLHSTMTPEIGQNIMTAIDNLLSAESENLIESQKLAAAPNRILQTLERFGNNVDLGNEESLLLNTNSCVVQVHDINQTDPHILGFASLARHQGHLINQPHVTTFFNNTNIDDMIENIEAAIQLPRSLYTTHSAVNLNQTKNRLVFTYYQKPFWFDQMAEVTGPLKRRRQQLNSPVISATWNGKEIRNLQENITTLFKPLTPHNSIEPATCVFWNFSQNNGRGAWLTEGCYYFGMIKGRYVCHCNHLTNFAVLMNIYDNFEDTEHNRPLSIISIIGLSLSCTGLVITIFTFITFRKFREGNAQKTLFQISVAQLISWLLFLVGVEQTQNPFVCVAVAAVLHYFLLATFMWMLMEAVLQYHAFVKVFGTHISYFMLKASLIAWGIPFIPVIIVLSLDYKLYLGYSKFCWLTPKILYYAFGIPVAVILIFNLIVFILIFKSITERKKGLRSNQTSKKKAMINLQAGFTSFMILGLSWIFGFLAIEEARTTFQYIFTILNTLQGFIIFLMFILRKQKVRQWWFRLLLKTFKISTRPTQVSSSYSNSSKLSSILHSRISSGSEISN